MNQEFIHNAIQFFCRYFARLTIFFQSKSLCRVLWSTLKQQCGEPSRIVSLDSSFKVVRFTGPKNERGDIFSFLRQVMALPFLPPEHIVPVFQHLEQRARSNLLITFMDYIWRQWITNPVFPVKNWSVFMLSVRTNNDPEGWHNRLNRHVNQQGPVPFYLLLTELYKEAENIPLQQGCSLRERWNVCTERSLEN